MILVGTAKRMVLGETPRPLHRCTAALHTPAKRATAKKQARGTRHLHARRPGAQPVGLCARAAEGTLRSSSAWG
jgi:hypothetical protein